MIHVGGGLMYPEARLPRLRAKVTEAAVDYSSDDHASLTEDERRHARREFIAFGTGPYAPVARMNEQFPELAQELTDAYCRWHVV